VKQSAGSKWMTIPVQNRSSHPTINEIEATAGPWRRQHRELVRHSLAKAPHLKDALVLMDRAYSKPKVVDLLIDSVEGPVEYLGLNRSRRSIRSSTLAVGSTGSQRILDLVRALRGTRYVTAHGAISYLDHEAFERAGVQVEYVQYSKTPYSQLHGLFNPYVTILDVIANLGRNASSVLRPMALSWRVHVGNS
jgi:hypothetical protein